MSTAPHDGRLLTLEAYQEAPTVTGQFVTQEPFELRIDLDRLARR